MEEPKIIGIPGKKIIEAAELPEEDRVYMKKGIFGWRVVHPIKNPDGSWNHVNALFGGWGNLIFTLLVVGAVCFMIYSHYHDLNAIRESCLTFKDTIVQGKAQIILPGIN